MGIRILSTATNNGVTTGILVIAGVRPAGAQATPHMKARQNQR